jgi:segregation and condensation protein B
MTEQTEKTKVTAMIEGEQLKQILEAALLAVGQPLSHAQLGALFSDEERPPTGEINRALEQLSNDCANRGVELRKVASGYRLQVKQDLNEWVSRLWKERPQRYSRALLETMALIAYRQPITRGEIESVRGVSVSTSIIRTLQEREWIRVVGHRDVPGKPALFGTTKTFLDSFDLQNLDDLPTLAEIRDMENLEPELQLEPAPPATDVRESDLEASNESDGDSESTDEPQEVLADEGFSDEDFDAEFEDMDNLEAEIDTLLDEVAPPKEPDPEDPNADIFDSEEPINEDPNTEETSNEDIVIEDTDITEKSQ